VVKKVYISEFDERRWRSRPRRRWHEMVIECVRKYGVNPDEVREFVNDRVKWKEFTRRSTYMWG